MHFSVEKFVLVSILSKLVNVVVKKGIIAHLASVKITASDGELKFTTTDGEMSITEILPGANVMQNGELAVDAMRLFEVVRKLPSDDSMIDLKLHNNSNLKLSCGEIEFLLPSLDGNHFPVISDEDENYQFSLNRDEIRLLLNKIKFAASSESTRINMKGVFIKSENDTLISAATDGHRLATAMVQKKIEPFSFILPRKAVNEVIKIFGNSENVAVSIHGRNNISRVKFTAENVSLITKLVAGVFPDFHGVLSRAFEFSVHINKNELQNAIERVSVVSSERSKSIKLSFADGKINLIATNSDSSFAKDVVSATHNIVGDFNIYFNYTYILDVLHCIDSDDVKFRLNSPSTPAMIKDTKNDELTYIIMPMSMQD